MCAGANSFFGESTLNKVSFLREDTEFLRESWTHATTRFLLFVNKEAFMHASDGGLWFVGQDVLGKIKESCLENKVFLGLDNGSHEESMFTYKKVGKDDVAEGNVYQGTPVYAINVTIENATEQDWFPKAQLQAVNFQTVFTLANVQATIYSHAKMYLDWQWKFKYCPNCSHEVKFVHGGCKWVCTNNKKSDEGETIAECPLTNVHGHNNLTFPRTDPVAIVAITNEDYSKICLVRTKRSFQDMKFYSCVAGFMEPGESVETAAEREIWEETGVKCSSVQLINSQPWPYPVNLMIGCVATVKFNGENEIVNLNHDRELLDAQWFDTEDIYRSIQEYDTGFALSLGNDLHIPGRIAVAFQLIEWICHEHAKRQNV